jgi:hypothetical protein
MTNTELLTRLARWLAEMDDAERAALGLEVAAFETIAALLERMPIEELRRLAAMVLKNTHRRC